MHNSFFVVILVTRLFTILFQNQQCTFRSVPHIDVNGVLTLEVADLYGDFKIVENGAWFPQHGAAAKGEGVALNGSYVLVKDIDVTHEPANCTILIPANQGEGDWRYKDAKLTLDASDPDHLVISLVAGTLYDHSAVPISYYLVGACTNNWSLADAVEFVDVNGVLTANVADLNGTFTIIKDRKWGTEYALNDAGVVMGEDYTLQLGGGNIALANPFAGYRNAVLTLTINGDDHILKLVSGTYYITQDDWFIPSSLLGWNCNDATKFDAVEGQANTYEKFFTTFSGEFKIVYGQWLVEFGAPKGKTGNWSVDTPIQLAYPCDNMKPEDPEAVYQNVTVTIVVNYETASAVLTIYSAPISGRRKIGELYYNLNGRDLTAKVTYQSINSQNYSGLTSLDIPASVTCNSQTYSVTSICDSAFYSCKSLTSVTIPNSVTSIGDWAFYNCSSLTSVTIPNSVTSIGTQAFRDCSGITAVHISDIAAWCAIEFSRASSFPLAYTKSGHLYLNDIEVTNLVIPNSVTSIGSYTFYKCSGLTSVTIPNSVTSIGSDAFGSCSGLTAVHISDIAAWCAIEFGNSGSNPLTSAKHLYLNNAEITNLIIPNSATSIGNYAFYACSGLTSVTIPNSVTSIGNNAFFLCSGLTAVYISDIAAWCAIEFGSTRASNPLFYAKHLYLNYAEITNLVIPNSVTSIGNYAFYNCSGLTTVTISTSVTTIGNGAFSGCSGFTSITIPNSVTSIGGSAFSNCSGLTSITIPNSVTSIGGSAFYKCSGLTHATILAETPPTLGTSTFPTNIPIYVPCGTLEAYKMATNWDKYKLEYQNTATLALEVANKIGGSVTTNREYDCVVDATITAAPDYGYHFVQWTDGNTNNPRDIVITQDTTFVAQFAKNTYCISLQPDQAEHGSVSGAGTFDYLDSKQIAAQANYGYRFTQWSDGVADNPRTIVLTQDTSFVAQFAKNTYTISLQSDMAEHGSVSGAGTFEYLDNKQIAAQANYGYHFMQWSDGNTDNPRMIELTQDTTFTAEFAKNTYTISTTSANPEWGTTAGGKSALYQDEVEISATPNYGYHFVRWNDNNTSNPRIITLTQDTAFTATFAKNVYSITKKAEHGSISGSSSAEYLDFVTLTVTPDYGYHFTQWSDGLKDNPRIFRLTQDTTFTAEFAYDRVGQCGKDLALVWSYDPNAKVLTIGNAGEFTDNMQFGAEAPAEMEELVIGNSVTAIGENAFAGISTLKKVTIGESVKTIHNNAFYNCVNLETIFNYRPTPTNAYSTAFDGVDKFECKLYVLPNSIDMYKNASVWRDFYYTYAIGAEETTVTTNDVKVEPQDNAATVTWPTSENAASYTIQITKDGVVFCTLIFNANGQLTGIAFAPGRDGQSMAPAAVMTANGLQFTVTGLDSNTQYGYSLTAKDANEQPIATYSGSFTTTSEGIATGVDNTAVESEITKILRNGEVLILRGGKTYTVQGQEVR